MEKKYQKRIREIVETLETGCFHLCPRKDIAPHEKSPSCWCQPSLEHRDPQRQLEVWIHKLAKDNPN